MKLFASMDMDETCKMCMKMFNSSQNVYIYLGYFEK